MWHIMSTCMVYIYVHVYDFVSAASCMHTYVNMLFTYVSQYVSAIDMQ